jgi:hypothetical protein
MVAGFLYYTWDLRVPGCPASRQATIQKTDRNQPKNAFNSPIEGLTFLHLLI